MMDMLWKLVWLHKREVLFPLRMSICCNPYRLLLLKKFMLIHVLIFIHANVLVPTETQAQTQLKF